MLQQKLVVTLCLIVLVIALRAQGPEKGWKNLFDGKSFTGWKKLAGNADYKIENGAIVGVTVASSPNTFLVTEEEYGDFIAEMEIKLEDSSINSGVQFKSKFDPAGREGKGLVYGYQFELDPSSRKWTGGIYDEARRGWLYPLTLNPKAQNAFKQGVYNKIRIESIGNTIKTWVNGTLTGYLVDTLSEEGFIGLQVHSVGKPEQVGKKMYWKNIRIKVANLKATPIPKEVSVVNLIPNSLTKYEIKNGWKLLFDGSSMKGWRSANRDSFPEKGWEIKDGAMNVLPFNGGESTNGGDIVTQEQFSAFDLTFEFKYVAGANSGLKYFVTLAENNKGSAIGLEYQVLDDKLHPDAKAGRDGNRTLASLYDLITAKKQERFLKPVGQWNQGRIVVYPNNHVEHFLNGIKVLEYERGSQAFRDLVAISKYKVWPNFGEAPKGRILLQDHGGAVGFRSIKIKTLK
ncbi:MAG: DUF1080 domain-containing protein [Chitinophagaceae bacterium]|nr:DUF1080 domain-containing protein [Chitinophagaceae bacterium]